MISGTVKWWDDKKGYGFIIPDGGGKDVYLHASQVIGGATFQHALATGVRVAFDIREYTKGPMAVKVRPADNPTCPAPAFAEATA